MSGAPDRLGQACSRRSGMYGAVSRGRMLWSGLAAAVGCDEDVEAAVQVGPDVFAAVGDVRLAEAVAAGHGAAAQVHEEGDVDHAALGEDGEELVVVEHDDDVGLVV